MEKVQLSKSILQMKYFENQLTTKMKKESGKYVMESSYMFCEQLVDGRLSFRGMNPEIEKLMEQENNMKNLKEEIKRETEVSDEQMAKRFKSSQVKTMGKKFQTKKNRHIRFPSDDEDKVNEVKSKNGFLKPKD
ncbi:Similar to MPHOSPH6: M-phase phosphoprotein 6 (Homo sapiens) [Cotesia congregata]|uniref:Similar to MPHOSPH6: M-phase phosphoprotein 6 (Homo sapiens) n=1 Tax=Cotesia congregata TaxID=51543 RepID=A0A8J2HH13_COTCN|nr:Similar to MPHOSPH6: M-phase phosphoprotein 6 (Homo sapiens) [Cotesia congregata]